MTSIHNRLSMSAMTRPGRKSYETHRLISEEIQRLGERDEKLAVIERSSRKVFAVMLAREARERIADKLAALGTIRHAYRPGRKGL